MTTDNSTGGLVALLLADARLPIGGHARSGSLEPALAAGLTDIPGFIDLQLQTIARTDAGTAVVARALALAGHDLRPVLRAWAARTPSAALREDAAIVGAALTRLAGRLWPGAGIPPSSPGPVALGVIAAHAGVAPDALARVVAHDTIQTITSATLKLAPGDPLEVAAWTLAAFPAGEALVAATAHLTDPDDIPAGSAPAIETCAETHTTATRRLFRA